MVYYGVLVDGGGGRVGGGGRRGHLYCFKFFLHSESGSSLNGKMCFSRSKLLFKSRPLFGRISSAN